MMIDFLHSFVFAREASTKLMTSQQFNLMWNATHFWIQIKITKNSIGMTSFQKIVGYF